MRPEALFVDEGAPVKPKLIGVGPTDPLPRNRLGPIRLELSSVHFTIIAGPGKGKQFRVEDDLIRIGTASENEIVLEDSTVSRQHATLHRDPEGLLLRDLGSTNGTYVHDNRIREIFLRPGTHVRFGSTTVAFELTTSEQLLVPHSSNSYHDLVGSSPAMRNLFALLDKVASRELTAILAGETGTGKEVCARAIHQASRRKDGPFVVLDCSALDRELGGSEIFGHEPGAFTGASGSRKGAFESADRGTIFVDELGELPLDLQAKLLRVLEQREVKRLGGNKPIKIDCRIIAATHRDLNQMVEAGQFREDLFFRFAQVVIRIPSLNERREDIELLASRFLEEVQRTSPGAAYRFAPGVLSALRDHSFTGNVRELKNLVMRASMLADGEEITHADLRLGATAGAARPEQPAEDDAGDESLLPMDRLQKKAVIDALVRNGYRRERTAKELGISMPTLRRWMRRLGIRPAVSLDPKGND